MERKLLTSVDSDNFKREFKISKVLIDNWIYWIASEIITLFQSQKPVNIKVDNIIQVLDFDRDCGFSSLLEELNNKKQELEHSISPQHSEIREILELYFYDIISVQIRDLSQDLHLEFSDLLKNLIDVQFDQASPKNLIVFLKELIQKLAYKRGELETKKRFYIEREKSAWKSFEKLSEQSDKNMWKAVKIALESKLESERRSCISFIVAELIQICQSYSISVKRTFTLLEQIKQSLQDKNSLNIIVSIPVFSLLNTISADEQEKLLEIWIGGLKLNHWGNSPASWQAIEQKLIANIEPVAYSIFSEFEALFVDYL
jgi:hypothetical protein